jgi:ATP-dependent protease ClpP protease subunit
LLAAHSGQSYDKVKQDSDRDYYMSAQEARDYGLVDEVLEPARRATPDAALGAIGVLPDGSPATAE